jgi:transposase InsO family protein
MMTAMLAARSIVLSPATVHKYMNTLLGLRSVTRKPKYHYTRGGEPHEVFGNLLEQDFSAASRNRKWCTDFTYLFLDNGAKRYNCTILDLYSREVVASKVGRRITAALARETLEAAIARADPPRGIILHSDQGTQFTSKEFVEFCRSKGVVQSMSKAGCPYDNAPMERYFNTLKAEEVNLHSYHTDEELNAGITNFAFGWYNNVRPHTYNNNLPPCKVL